MRLPKDAIAIGKAATHLAMDSLGMTSQFVHGYVSHALGTNIRYEEGEFNFMKKRRDQGVRTAAHEREGHFSARRHSRRTGNATDWRGEQSASGSVFDCRRSDWRDARHRPGLRAKARRLRREGDVSGQR